MDWKLIVTMLILSCNSFATRVVCSSQGSIEQGLTNRAYGIRCGDSTNDGWVSPYTTPDAVEIYIYPSGRTVTVSPTCGGTKCTLAQIQSRRFDDSTYQQLRTANGGLPWDGLNIHDLTFNNGEKVRYLTSMDDLTPSDKMLSDKLDDSHLPGRVSSPGAGNRVRGEVPNDEYTSCHYTDPRTGNDVPPRVYSEEARNSCGGPSSKNCRGTVRCFSLYYGRRLTGEAMCSANPDGSCPGADECANSASVSASDGRVNGSTSGSGNLSGAVGQ